MSCPGSSTCTGISATPLTSYGGSRADADAGSHRGHAERGGVSGSEGPRYAGALQMGRPDRARPEPARRHEEHQNDLRSLYRRQPGEIATLTRWENAIKLRHSKPCYLQKLVWRGVHPAAYPPHVSLCLENGNSRTRLPAAATLHSQPPARMAAPPARRCP